MAWRSTRTRRSQARSCRTRSAPHPMRAPPRDRFARSRAQVRARPARRHLANCCNARTCGIRTCPSSAGCEPSARSSPAARGNGRRSRTTRQGRCGNVTALLERGPQIRRLPDIDDGTKRACPFHRRSRRRPQRASSRPARAASPWRTGRHSRADQKASSVRTRRRASRASATSAARPGRGHGDLQPRSVFLRDRTPRTKCGQARTLRQSQTATTDPRTAIARPPRDYRTNAHPRAEAARRPAQRRERRTLQQ